MFFLCFALLTDTPARAAAATPDAACLAELDRVQARMTEFKPAL